MLLVSLLKQNLLWVEKGHVFLQIDVTDEGIIRALSARKLSNWTVKAFKGWEGGAVHNHNREEAYSSGESVERTQYRPIFHVEACCC